MYELATVRPHERRATGYTREQWPIYCEGYYMALCMALKVMRLAAERFARRRRDRRAAGKIARATNGAA